MDRDFAVSMRWVGLGWVGLPKMDPETTLAGLAAWIDRQSLQNPTFKTIFSIPLLNGRTETQSGHVTVPSIAVMSCSPSPT